MMGKQLQERMNKSERQAYVSGCGWKKQEQKDDTKKPGD